VRVRCLVCARLFWPDFLANFVIIRTRDVLPYFWDPVRRLRGSQSPTEVTHESPECHLQLSISKDMDKCVKIRKYNIHPPKSHSAVVLGRRV
jgi:hypothetical protein